MPMRPLSHQLEDASRNKFASLIPKEWVFRDKNKDYGIDGEVEIFEGDKATGLVFLVQLKATAAKKKSTIRNVTLKTDRVAYYRTLELPVLIARYSLHEDCFYCMWASYIDPYPLYSAGTIRVHFSDSDKLNEQVIKNLRKYVESLKRLRVEGLGLPLATTLEFLQPLTIGMPSGLLASEIRQLAMQRSLYIELSNTKEGKYFSITVDGNNLTTNLLGLASATFHNIESSSDESVSEVLFSSALIGFAICASRLGFHEVASKLIFGTKIETPLVNNIEIFKQLITSFIQSDYYADGLNLASRAADITESNEYEIYTQLAVMMYGKSHQNQSVENFLVENIHRNKKRNSALHGSAHYNIGNFYRSIGEIRKAVRHYLKAVKLNAVYKDQDYFWSELGGYFFDLGKYSASAECYKKSLSIKFQIYLLPLHADALMFNGQYRLALNKFEQYHKESAQSDAEWRLKTIFLEDIVEKQKVNSQKRQVAEALKKADICGMDFDVAEIQLNTSLKLDYLCGLAWFNKGHIAGKSEEIDSTAFYMMSCAVCQRWDTEAWVNATLASMNKLIPVEIFATIIEAAYSAVDEKYLTLLYRKIQEQVESERHAQFTNQIEEIVSTFKKNSISKTVRFYDETDNIFRDISALL